MSNYAECIDDMLGAAKEVQTPAAQYYKSANKKSSRN